MMSYKWSGAHTFKCESCGKDVLRKYPRQRYCAPCSDAKSLERQGPKRAARQAAREAASIIAKETGIKTSELHAEDIGVDLSRPLDHAWLVRILFPFSYASSKNAVWSLAKGGTHLFLRQKARWYRDDLIAALRDALHGRRIYQNRLWIEIFVQKPNHRGDAVNVVDTVCDALKEAAGIDDRWFSIKRLDWQIVKHEPQLIIGISQEECDSFDAQSCHRCGRILPFSAFNKQRSMKNGISRQCRDCKRGRVVTPGDDCISGCRVEITTAPEWTARKVKQRKMA